MTPSKLSEADKQDIISRYRSSDETTTTLANRYEVSTTTISRILKNALSESEYETLVQQKRSGRSQTTAEPIATETALPTVPALPTAESGAEAAATGWLEPAGTSQALPDPADTSPRRRRKRSSSASSSVESELESETTILGTQLPLDLAPAAISPIEITPTPIERVTVPEAPVTRFAPILRNNLLNQEDEDEDDLLDQEEDLDQDDDEFGDLDDDDDDEDDEDDDDELEPVYPRRSPSRALVQVLPFAEASIPRTFYLVVDRAAELITRPLRDFGELGQIPDAETQEKTLPIFDNHRVAKRFSKKNQRIIKVPDGRMLQKVGNYLQAKGITRLLIDGQVYSL